MKKLYFILLTLVSLQLFAQTTGKKIYVKVSGSSIDSQSWLTSGNSNLDPTIHFLGYNDRDSLQFKVAGQPAGHIRDAHRNTSLGMFTQDDLTTGYNNTAFGHSSSEAITTGYENSSFGNMSLYFNKVGSSNVAIGTNALYNNNTDANTAVGPNALYSTTNGSNNVGVGGGSLRDNITGWYNTAIGENSGNNSSTPLTSLTNSVFVGKNTSATANGLTNVVVVGFGAQATKSNQTVLGNLNTTETLLRGNVKLPKLNMYNIPTYEGQDSAVKHGLSNGDVFRLPPDARGTRLLAIVDTVFAVPEVFNFIIDNTTGTALPKFTVDGYDGNFDMRIDWGDGNIDSTSYIENNSFTASHIYSTNQEFIVQITFSNIAKIQAFGTGLSGFPCRIISINNADLLTSLLALNLSKNELYTLPNASLPATITSLDLSENNWNSSQVNAALVYLNGLTFNTGTKTLDIRQFNNAIPSGAGATAKTSLEGKEWVITTD